MVSTADPRGQSRLSDPGPTPPAAGSGRLPCPARHGTAEFPPEPAGRQPRAWCLGRGTSRDGLASGVHWGEPLGRRPFLQHGRGPTRFARGPPMCHPPGQHRAKTSGSGTRHTGIRSWLQACPAVLSDTTSVVMFVKSESSCLCLSPLSLCLECRALLLCPRNPSSLPRPGLGCQLLQEVSPDCTRHPRLPDPQASFPWCKYTTASFKLPM